MCCGQVNYISYCTCKLCQSSMLMDYSSLRLAGGVHVEIESKTGRRCACVGQCGLWNIAYEMAVIDNCE